MRQRFPQANLVVENRALGGYASQLLVKTAETDLYPFQPDLLIFHVYGSHDKYEDLIRRTRERTCAEILMQNDHVTKPGDLIEETDPAKVPIQSGQWDAFMNHNWLPSLAKKYDAELCDQRSICKTYLTDHDLEPNALLKDEVHLNAHHDATDEKRFTMTTWGIFSIASARERLPFAMPRSATGRPASATSGCSPRASGGS